MTPPDRLASRRQADKKHTKARQALGQCIRCKDQALPNNLRCEYHRNIHRERQRTLKDRRALHGTCKGCGLAKVKLFARCSACRDRHNEWRRALYAVRGPTQEQRARRARRAALGQCTNCKLQALPNRTTCAYHGNEAAAASRRSVASRSDGGFCNKCGRVSVSRFKRCPTCRARENSYNLAAYARRLEGS